MSVFFQHADRQLLVDNVVLGQQDTKLAQIGAFVSVLIAGDVFWCGDPQCSHNRVEQLRLLDGFHQPFRNPQLIPQESISLTSTAGQDNDLDVGKVQIASQLFNEIVATHFGHVHIADNQPERFAAILRTLHLAERKFAASQRA